MSNDVITVIISWVGALIISALPSILNFIFESRRTDSQEQKRNEERIRTWADSNKPSLMGIDLSGKYLRGINLIGADLKNSNFEDARLMEANLMGADLRDANLRNAYLQYANLNQAKLDGANLQGATLAYATFHNAKLTNVNLSKTNLTYTFFDGADLSGANFDAAKWGGTVLDGAILPHGFKPTSNVITSWTEFERKQEPEPPTYDEEETPTEEAD